MDDALREDQTGLIFVDVSCHKNRRSTTLDLLAKTEITLKKKIFLLQFFVSSSHVHQHKNAPRACICITKLTQQSKGDASTQKEQKKTTRQQIT